MFGLFKKRDNVSEPVAGLEEDADEFAVRPFGYKMSWLAVRGDPQEIIGALGITDTRDVTWSEGLRVLGIVAHPMPEIRVFVSPSISGWTLVVGWALPQLDLGMNERFQRFAKALDQHEYAYFFATHRVVEGHAWAIIQRGVVTRAFSYVGDQGEVLANLGVQTPEEKALGLPSLDGVAAEQATETFFALVDDGGELPSEESVIELARQWSIDPTTLDTLDLPPSTVILGSLPTQFVTR